MSGDLTFYYSTDDQQWHTGRLSLTAPSTYKTKFTLTLPDGITEETGKTQVSAGESFSLVSKSKPESSPSIQLSSTIPWMDPALKVYVADSTVTDSEGKGFQNMIGAVVRKTPVSVTANLSVSTADFAFTKAWDDGNNRDGKRPDIPTFISKLHLKADGVELTGYTPTVTDNGDGTWTVQYKGLPGLSGDKAYTVTEDDLSPYTADAGTVSDGGTLTNSYTPETVTVSGKKVWEDRNNQDGNRPGSITVNLLADGARVDSRTVKADTDGNWTYSFTGLPKYKNGQTIDYTVTEDAVDGYSTVISDYDIYNQYTPGKTSVTVTKVWADQNDQDGKRPDGVQVQLYADGKKSGDPVTLNEADSWTYTWTGLDEKSAGTAIVYTVQEAEVPDGYTASVSGSAEKGFVITNTHQPETIDVSGTKTWDDGNNQDGNRPESITVNLLADGVQKESATVQAGSDGTWTWQFTGLPKYQSGKAIDYTVTEDAVDGYSTEISGYDITNRYTPGKTSVTVTKDWADQNDQDGKRPDSVQVQLYADGKKSGDPVTLNEADSWTYTWTGLDEKSRGETIAYTVQEVSVPEGYTASVSGSAEKGFVITNSHTPETIEVSGTKIWDDGNNQDGKRPESITVNLLADGVQKESATVQAGADGKWTYSFTGLPKYQDGHLIDYTVTEDAVKEYSTEISGYDITNRYTPGKTSVTVTKDWEDRNDPDGKRPDSVQIQLYADGRASGDPVKLTAKNNWTYTWSGLDEMSGGKAVEYTVSEVNVPNGYTSLITGSAKNGFTVINALEPTNPAGNAAGKTGSSPGTGDGAHALLYGVVTVLALTAALLVSRRKRRRK
ncbi:MAG: Cna B-type domain-containing protein [Lachnospiraceae bacterium]|nr:Cna B-type domain-containing protein [Lachnospiraceae bacterium]MCI1327982.1 Cna B-type domain-containing protein [Lachnospiraceae bacterium]